MENKIFLAFGVLALISGLLLFLYYQNYVLGASGAAVGGWLAWDNYSKLKNRT